MKTSLKMPPAVVQVGARIDAMTLRERAIIFMSMLAALFLLADQVLFPAQRAEQQRMEKQVNDQLAQLGTLNSQIERIVRDNVDDPDAVLQGRLKDLRTQYAALELEAGDIARGLVSPREMTRLIHVMLRENRALELVRAENLAPEPVALGGSDPAAKPAGSEPAVYRHGLKIQVKGRYTDIVRYLHTLERLNWRVMWGEVNLETERYPVTTATLTVYTLSLDRAWIGV